MQEGGAFEAAADAYVRRFLERGIPSLFSSLKALYRWAVHSTLVVVAGIVARTKKWMSGGLCSSYIMYSVTFCTKAVGQVMESVSTPQITLQTLAPLGQ